MKKSTKKTLTEAQRIAKRERDRRYRAAKKARLAAGKKAVKKVAKPTKKVVLKEKIVLPKKAVKKVAVTKKIEAKKPVVQKPNPDTIVTVKNGNPFKVFFLATLIRDRAKAEIIKGGKVYFS